MTDQEAKVIAAVARARAELPEFDRLEDAIVDALTRTPPVIDYDATLRRAYDMAKRRTLN